MERMHGPPGSGDARPGIVPRPWPLTGRDAELRTVLAALRRGSPGVVLAGGAGVGKTRLVREAVAARHLPAGRRVVWVQGSVAARALPLGAFAGVALGRSGVAGTAADPVARTLAELAASGPVLLVVDDAHLLDELSVIVVHRTVTRGLAPAVVTIRTGEAVPDLVTALWKDDHLPRLDLAPLGRDDAATLVAQVLGGRVEAASAHRLWALTGGSPLFLRHLLAGELDAGRFAASAGTWRWVAEPVLTPELTALLRDQMGALDAGVRDAVDLVALGEPLAVGSLTALSSPDAVEAAEARGLVRLEDAGGGMAARLAHPLYGEIRRAAMGRLRARRLRGLVAGTLADAPDPLRRAVLALESDLPSDPALFRRAATAAIRLYDLPLAERLARAAAASGDVEARIIHASALSWLTRGEEAEALLREVAASGPEAPLLALTHLFRSGNLLFTLGRPEQAAAALAAAERAGGAPAHAGAMRAVLAIAQGDAPGVLADAPGLLAAAWPDDLAALLGASAVSAAAAVAGRIDLLERGAVLGGLSADHPPTGIPGFGLADWQVLGHRLAGQPDRARGTVQALVAASGDLPAPARWMGLVVAGHAALAAGRVGEAIAALQEAWPGLAASDHEFRFRCRTLLVTALALASRPADARAVLAGPDAADHPAYRLLRPDDVLALAWVEAAEGAVSEARRRAEEAAGLARRQSSPAYEVLAWQTVVQVSGVGGAAGVADAVAGLTPLAGLSPRAEAAWAHARASAAGDADALLVASERWEALGDLVPAVDAAAQGAEAYRQRGRPGSALAAAARAGHLADRSGARTPALLAAVRPVPLTSREREIAALAGRGLSNREIALRLTVSVRTVEGHLYRAGHKLGISERTGFAALQWDGSA